ncbi:MAG TPA: hypothetical protein VJ927_03945 [Actinomycetota bacterium]|nr:hypothetical protein [Actinomycetota bacterium]
MNLAAAPQILEHPCCDFINEFPWGFFLVVHIALFAVGAFFALRAFESGTMAMGWGFALFALAEITYMTYHVNITQFLFSHTIAEVLDGLAFVALFVGAVQSSAIRGTVRAPSSEATAIR